MYAASVGKKQIGKTLMIIVALVAVVLVAFYVIGKIKDKNGSDAANVVSGETEEQREEYLRSVGVQVDPTSSVAEVKVPDEFDERFTEYNEMLKTIGFDLSGLKGETVKKCTYIVTNKPELGENISAVLLISKGKIVAGHLLDPTTGLLNPLFAQPEQSDQPDQVEQTILPVEPSTETVVDPATDGEDIAQETIGEGAYPTE